MTTTTRTKMMIFTPFNLLQRSLVLLSSSKNGSIVGSDHGVMIFLFEDGIQRQLCSIAFFVFCFWNQRGEDLSEKIKRRTFFLKRRGRRQAVNCDGQWLCGPVEEEKEQIKRQTLLTSSFLITLWTHCATAWRMLRTRGQVASHDEQL